MHDYANNSLIELLKRTQHHHLVIRYKMDNKSLLKIQKCVCVFQEISCCLATICIEN